MGCFSNKKKRKGILLTNESNIIIYEKIENIKEEKPKLEKKNTETKPKNYSKLGWLRFNSKSYVNPFPKLFLDKNQDEKVLHTNRNNHIIHLVKSLNKNANLKEKENYDKIREYINWTLSKNINGENIWINNGKIILSKNEIEKIINTPEEKN